MERKLSDLMKTSSHLAVDIEGTILRIRTSPTDVSLTDIVDSMRSAGIPTDIIFLCYKAANILDSAQAEHALRRALGEADTDPPPPPAPTVPTMKAVKS